MTDPVADPMDHFHTDHPRVEASELLDPGGGPDEDPEEGLDEWEGVTTTRDPHLPEYDEPDEG